MKTVSKRKVITFTTIVVVLMIIIAIISFNKSRSNGDNKSCLNTVIDIEKNVYNLNKLNITYDEFKKNTDKYLSKYLSSFYNKSYNLYAQDNFLYAITGKHYSEKDFIGLSLDELRKIGEPLKQSIQLNVKSFDYSSIEISKVFEENNNSNTRQDFRYVYVKYTINSDKETMPLYKKYSFIKDNNKYVLFSIEYLSFVKNKVVKNGNEIVKFEQKINLDSNN